CALHGNRNAAALSCDQRALALHGLHGSRVHDRVNHHGAHHCGDLHGRCTDAHRLDAGRRGVRHLDGLLHGARHVGYHGYPHRVLHGTASPDGRLLDGLLHHDVRHGRYDLHASCRGKNPDVHHCGDLDHFHHETSSHLDPDGPGVRCSTHDGHHDQIGGCLDD